MDKPLSKSAQKVQDVLAKKNLPFEVIELAASTHTANDAANALGCTVAQIVKSLIFKTQTSHKPILVLASGVNRVNEKLIEKQMNETVIKGDADFTRDVTGFSIGGVPPVGHLQPLITFIDEDLLQHDILWAAAGTPNAVFKLQSANLLDLTSGKVIAIK